MTDERVKQLEAETRRLRKLVWGAVHNAGRTGRHRPRWSAVTDALGVGSTTAVMLCMTHGLNPDDLVGRDDDDDGDEA